jgi:hypothetical protein
MSLPSFHCVSIPTAPTVSCPPSPKNPRGSKITAVVQQTHAAFRASRWVVIAAPVKCKHGLREDWCAICKEPGLADARGTAKPYRYHRAAGGPDVVRYGLASSGSLPNVRYGYSGEPGCLRRVETRLVVLTPEECERQERGWKHVAGRRSYSTLLVRDWHVDARSKNFCPICEKPLSQGRYICASHSKCYSLTTWLAYDKLAAERDRLLDSDALTMTLEIADNVLMMEPQEAVLFVKAHIRLQTEQRMAAKGYAQARYFAEIFSDIKQAFLKFAPRRALQC